MIIHTHMLRSGCQCMELLRIGLFGLHSFVLRIVVGNECKRNTELILWSTLSANSSKSAFDMETGFTDGE
jgi:hypothetical protein